MSYLYNPRHLPTHVGYSAPTVNPPGSPIPLPPQVDFGYDAAGNRTSMSDGTGSMTYVYDSLSRMTSETKTFTGLSGSYRLDYQYNLANQITLLSIPFNSQQIGYSYDAARRLSGVSAAGFTASYSNWPNTYTQAVTSFASNITYRAWGGRKSMAYGNTVTDSITYNARMQPAGYTLNNVNYSNAPIFPPTNYTSMSWTYDYYDDGLLHHAWDSSNNWFDRAYSYDHARRLNEASTYRRAAGLSPFPAVANADPYYQTTAYDVWGNITNQAGSLYTGDLSDSGSYTNNRRVGWAYNADGNVTDDLRYQHTFEAAGRSQQATSATRVGDGTAQFPYRSELEITQSYDGDGASRKRVQLTRMNDYDPNNGQLQVLEENQTSYYVKSTVLEGAIVVELDHSGAEKSVSVHAGGERIAQAVNGNVTFEHHNPATPSWVVTNGHADSRMAGREERDPANAELPLTTPNPRSNSYVGHNWGEQLFIEGGDPWDYVSGVTLDGMPMTRSDYNRLVGRAGGMVFADFVGYHVDWRDGSRLGLTLSYLGSAVLSPLPQGRSGRRSGGASDPQNPVPRNPNCIERAVAGGTLGTTRGLIPKLRFVPGRGAVPTGTAGHDGIHVYAPPGPPAGVTALPAMAGRILWGNRQGKLGTPDYQLGIMDVLLNTRINGQQYVMTLKDVNYRDMQRSGTIQPDSRIGTVDGSADMVGETGLHVTLMPYSTYQKHIGNRPTAERRRSVPFSSLMDAARDPASPFRCP